MKKTILLLLAVVALDGCGIYKKYDRPGTDISGLYGPGVPDTGTQSVAQLHWKQIFTDSLLQNLIEEGLRYNTDLRVACLKVQEARATLQTSRLAYLPSVSLEPGGTVSRSGSQAATRSYQLAASAGWEIDLFGKLSNARQGAKAALEQSEAYRQAVQTQLIATIAGSYYTLLMLDEQLNITRRTALTWNRNVKVMRALKAAGQANQAAVAQSEASRLSVEASVLSLQQQISETQNSLSALLAGTPRTIRRGTLAGQDFPDTLSLGVPLALLGRRPDVKQAEYALKQAFYTTNEARSSFYPSITLSGSAGWTNSGGGTIVNPGSWLLQAVGSLVQPIFNRGTNIARLKIAKARQEEALLDFQQTLYDAGSEVNNALVRWQAARGRIRIGEEQIVALGSAVKNTRSLMTYGNTNYLEVLTAQQTLLQAELTRVSDRFDEIQGVISLYHALGGGSIP